MLPLGVATGSDHVEYMSSQMRVKPKIHESKLELLLSRSKIQISIQTRAIIKYVTKFDLHNPIRIQVISQVKQVK